MIESREVLQERPSVKRVVEAVESTLLPKNKIAEARKKEGHEIEKAESKVLWHESRRDDRSVRSLMCAGDVVERHDL